MNNCLKHYHCVLHTAGPVFVGSGRELSKKEYMFLPDGKIGVMSIEKLYFLIRKKHLEMAFEDFMTHQSRTDLKHWLMEHKISLEESKRCMKYVIDSGDTVLQRGTKTAIMEMVRDAYGMPYIPGSSIKGMFRTILLSSSILGKPGEFARNKQELLMAGKQDRVNKNRYLLPEVKKVEQRQFCTLEREGTKTEDAVNDIMSGFIVSDSEPLRNEDLVLCQKVEKHMDGNEKRLNLLRECICPQKEIHFELTIDEQICRLTWEQLEQAASDFAESYNDCFLSSFSGGDRLRNGQVYLGGGAGFVSKTIVYPLFGKKEGVLFARDVFDKTKVPREHKHYKDVQWNVSPHILKCTRYQGTLYQMGLCNLKRV